MSLKQARTPRKMESIAHKENEVNVFKDLQGAVLEGDIILQAILRRANHADIYAVEGPGTAGLVARVYDLRNIPNKARQYRRRNLKRSLGPKVKQIHWQGYIVLLCPHIDNNKAATSTRPPVMATQTNTTTVEKSKGREKSLIQRESARIRQLEKRRAQRHKKSQALAGPSLHKSPSPTFLSGFDDEKTFYTMALLWLGSTADHETRADLPLASKQALEEYFQSDSVKLEFDDIQQMESFLRSKRREFQFLNQSLKSLPEMIERRTERLFMLLYPPNDPASRPKSSEVLKNTVEETRIVKHELIVLNTAKDDILPKMMKISKRGCRLLESRLGKLRKIKAEIDERLNIVWSRVQVPGSGTFGLPSEGKSGSKQWSKSVEALRQKYISLLEFPIETYRSQKKSD